MEKTLYILTGVAILVIISVVIAWYFFVRVKPPKKDIQFRAYKMWLVQTYGEDVASIANYIYSSMARHQAVDSFAIMDEFNGKDKAYTSGSYIRTARGIIKQVKYMKKHGSN